MKKAKVGIVTTDFSTRSGGVFEAISGQARTLMPLNRPLEIFNLQPEERNPIAPKTDLRVQEIHTKGPLKLVAAGQLASRLRQHNAQIVHTHGLWIPVLSRGVQKWRQRNRGLLVVSPHGMLDPWALKNSRWKKRIALSLYERKLLNAADCFHALNLAEAKSIRALGFTVPIAVIPNGVVLPETNQTDPVEPYDDDRKTLVFLGRLHPKKGLMETLSAWAKLTANHPEISQKWRVIIAGWDDGDHRALLEQALIDLELEKDVSFVGAVFGAEKHALLSRAGAFILASHSEGLPMAVLEAWAHCIPVFMTKQCNLPQGFETGAALEIGLTPDGIADVLALHLMREDLNSVGQLGRTLVETQFTWKSVGLQLDALYAWLNGENDARPDTILL